MRDIARVGMRSSLKRQRTPVRSGLAQLLKNPGNLKGHRLGLVANPASVTPDLVHASLALKESRAWDLVALFGPEHGIWGNAQDLIEVKNSRDPKTNCPIFSLYGETRRPTEEMLQDIDTLLIDLPDIGVRYYTFIYTMLYALEACAHYGRRVVILDRPNPLGGIVVEGNVLDSQYQSFVGLHPLPVRHGMTIGELALLFRDERNLPVDLTVIRMKSWRREMSFEDTGLPWVLPSPNMPTVETAYVYSGGCLIEGTNLSEGRGTTRPFEIVGAPWIDPWRLARDMNREAIPGVLFRPLFFTPTFHKYAGLLCGGVQVHVTDRQQFPGYLAYLLLIHNTRRQDPLKFAWREPPYEYELVKLPIDILCGTDHIRLAIEKGVSIRRLLPTWRQPLMAFRRRRAKYLLY